MCVALCGPHGGLNMADIASHRTRSSGAPTETQPHTKARSEKPAEYPDRFPVPDRLVKWAAPYPEYAPPRYEAPSTLAKSPDPVLFSDVKRTLTSHEPGAIRVVGLAGNP